MTVRRGVKAVAAVTALVALTGCKIKIDVSAQVDADESGTITLAYLLDDDEVFEDVFEQMLSDVPEGWDAQRHREGDLAGIRMSADFSSLAELEERLTNSGEVSETLESGAAVLGGPGAGGAGNLAGGFSLVRDGAEFRFEFDADAAGLGEGSSLATTTSTTEPAGEDDDDNPLGQDFEGLRDDFSDIGEAFGEIEAEAVVSITLPGKVLEHNADEKDGSRLTWRLTPGESRSLSAVSDSSQASGGGGDFPMVPVLAGLLVAGVVIGVMLSRRGGQGGTPPPSLPPPPPPD